MEPNHLLKTNKVCQCDELRELLRAVLKEEQEELEMDGKSFLSDELTNRIRALL
jgi:hypothetical protein